MTGADGTLDDGAELALRALAAVAGAAWQEAGDAGWGVLAELVAVVCAAQHGLEPLAMPIGTPAGRWTGPDGSRWASVTGLGDADRSTLDFAQQFSVDVSAVTEGQRQGFFQTWGNRSASVAAVIFAMDFLPRASAALSALDVPEVPEAGATAEGIWPALDSLIRTVPRLDGLDPVTSELVRLRGARQHRCRLCQSLRSRPALVAGADESLFASVDHHEQSDLPPLEKAALALTDAMIWTPARTGPAARQLSALTTVSQRVELVADVTRNALNKIAVALAADAAHVEDGIEIYDVDPDGELVYGLTLD
jgi:alkylhydroperoxidase family enzyme